MSELKTFAVFFSFFCLVFLVSLSFVGTFATYNHTLFQLCTCTCQSASQPANIIRTIGTLKCCNVDMSIHMHLFMFTQWHWHCSARSFVCHCVTFLLSDFWFSVWRYCKRRFMRQSHDQRVQSPSQKLIWLDDSVFFFFLAVFCKI